MSVFINVINFANIKYNNGGGNRNKTKRPKQPK